MGGVSALIYGTREPVWANAIAAIAVDSDGLPHLFATRDATAENAAMSFLNITGTIKSFSTYGGALAFDPTILGRIFVAGGPSATVGARLVPQVYLVQTDFVNCEFLAGCDATARNLGRRLPSTLAQVNTVTAIDNNGVRALFAGGVSTAAPSPPTVDAPQSGNLYVRQDSAAGDWTW